MGEVMDMIYLGTAPRKHNFMPLLLNWLDRLSMSISTPSLRIGLPIVSPGAPCTHVCGRLGTAGNVTSLPPFHVTSLTIFCLPSFLAIFFKDMGQTSESIGKSQSVVSESSVTTCHCNTSFVIRTDSPCLEIFWKLEKWEYCQKDSSASSLQVSDGDERWVIPRRQSIYQAQHLFLTSLEV